MPQVGQTTSNAPASLGLPAPLTRRDLTAQPPRQIVRAERWPLGGWRLPAAYCRSPSAYLRSPSAHWRWAAGYLWWALLVVSVLACAAVASRHGTHDLAIMTTIFAAAAVSSVAGFAFCPLAGAVLFQMSDNTVHIIQIMLVCSIANQMAMTLSLRRNIDWRGLSVYLAGGLPGVAVGVWFLMHADPTDYRRAFGAIILAYASYMLLRRPITIRWQPIAFDVVTGFAGGVTGGVAATPSFPVLVWTGLKGWDKTRQRAMFQPFILVIQIVAIVAISLWHPAGSAQPGFALGDLLYIPAAVLGTSLGLTYFRGMTDRQFVSVVNVLLIVSGLAFFL